MRWGNVGRLAAVLAAGLLIALGPSGWERRGALEPQRGSDLRERPRPPAPAPPERGVAKAPD
ncbi:MAG: hypothetical protein ACREX8_07555, partial [Gammaproteobacteria bacterium]